MTLGIPVAPTHQTAPMNVQQLPPLGPHRKTLERNIRNNHHNQLPPIPNGMSVESSKMMIDGNFDEFPSLFCSHHLIFAILFDDVLIVYSQWFFLQVTADWEFLSCERHRFADNHCADQTTRLTTVHEL
jgi:hypothetical protein